MNENSERILLGVLMVLFAAMMLSLCHGWWTGDTSYEYEYTVASNIVEEDVDREVVAFENLSTDTQTVLRDVFESSSFGGTSAPVYGERLNVSLGWTVTEIDGVPVLFRIEYNERWQTTGEVVEGIGIFITGVVGLFSLFWGVVSGLIGIYGRVTVWT